MQWTSVSNGSPSYKRTYIECWGLFEKTVSQLFFLIILTGMLNATPSKNHPKNHVDPWSKIVITSNKATCHKDKAHQKNFIFKYLDNVIVTLADNSTVKADELELVLDSTKNTKSTKNLKSGSGKKPEASDHKKTLSQLKQLSFKNHVVFNSGQRKACADRVVIDVAKNICTLDGNVKIWQAKENPKDVPITIESQKAIMHLKTFAVQLAGTSEHPVSTTIDLEGHPSVQQKSKSRAKNKA